MTNAKAGLLAIIFTLHSALPSYSQNMIQTLDKFRPPPPDPRNMMPQLGGGPIPGIAGPGGVPCNIQMPALPTPPSAEEIAKLVKIPTEDIAKKIIELQKAPFEALGSALADKLQKAANEKVDALREWLWEKARPFLYFIAIMTAILASMMIGLPMKALLHRVPIKRRQQ